MINRSIIDTAKCPVLETERLLLRLPQISDFDGYAELLADEEAAQYIGGMQIRAAAWRKFLQQPGAWLVQGFGMFSVIEKSSGEWTGQLGPWFPEAWPGHEIGWAFRRKFWNKGYAYEAAQAAVDWAFEQLGWDEVTHCIHPENLASQKLAQRLGAVNQGPITLPAPFETSPTELWLLKQSTWRQQRNSIKVSQ